MADRTVLCKECGRVVKVKHNRFGDDIYARHKMKTREALYHRSSREEAVEETYGAPNPIAFGIDELDCPNSGQPLEDE